MAVHARARHGVFAAVIQHGDDWGGGRDVFILKTFDQGVIQFCVPCKGVVADGMKGFLQLGAFSGLGKVTAVLSEEGQGFIADVPFGSGGNYQSDPGVVTFIQFRKG